MTNEALKIGLYWTGIAARQAYALYRVEIEKGFYGNADQHYQTMNDARKAAEHIRSVLGITDDETN